MANKYFRKYSIPSAATETTLTPHYLQKVRPLAVNATFDVFNGIPCVLEAGDVLKVESSVASTHFYLSYLEMDRN